MGAGLSAALGQRAREVCRARLRSDAGGWVRRFGRATRVACGPNGRRGEELGRARMLWRQRVSGPCGSWLGARGSRPKGERVNPGRAGRGGCWARVRGKVGGLGCWFWAGEKGSGPVGWASNWVWVWVSSSILFPNQTQLKLYLFEFKFKI